MIGIGYFFCDLNVFIKEINNKNIEIGNKNIDHIENFELSQNLGLFIFIIYICLSPFDY